MEAILAERIRTFLNFIVGLSTSPVFIYIKGEATLLKLKNFIRKIFSPRDSPLSSFLYIVYHKNFFNANDYSEMSPNGVLA